MSELSPVRRFPITFKQMGPMELFLANVFTIWLATELDTISEIIGFESGQSVEKYKPHKQFITVVKSGTLHPLQNILEDSFL